MGRTMKDWRVLQGGISLGRTVKDSTQVTVYEEAEFLDLGPWCGAGYVLERVFRLFYHHDRELCREMAGHLPWNWEAIWGTQIWVIQEPGARWYDESRITRDNVVVGDKDKNGDPCTYTFWPDVIVGIAKDVLALIEDGTPVPEWAAKESSDVHRIFVS